MAVQKQQRSERIQQDQTQISLLGFA
ncbi:hypothetical protein V12B01_13330 [Vibrio splendidus 12B01]|nr:hypothetical protein V12B01_13330 [Vibrio splendidus 12B01]